MGKIRGALAVLALSLLATPAQAGFFMLMDANGDVSFTDTPPDRRSRKLVVKYFQTNGAETMGRLADYRFSNVYDPIIRAAAAAHGLDPILVKSVIKVESDFDRRTISSKGAKGLMQLMPDTARDLNVKNVFNPEDNIHGGARYLKRMLDKFSGDARLALAAYNAGPTAVETYGGVPPYQETVQYISRVFRAYSHLAGYNYPITAVSVSRAAIPPRAGAKPKTGVIYKSKAADGALVYSDKPGPTKIVMRD
jgi:soluble lytic murein transglycosylase